MKQNLQNEMFDAMLRSAFQERRQQGDRELLTEQELREQDIEPQQFSPAFERKMKKLIKKVGRREWRRTHRKTMQHVAALFAVVFLTGGILMTKVDAVRVPVGNILFTIGEEFSTIQVQQERPTQTISKKFAEYLPTYIPVGFFVESVDESKHECYVSYSDGGERYYSVDFYASARGGAVDTEDSIITEIEIRGYPAIMLQKAERTMLLWYPANHEYFIVGNVPREELFAVLESIENIF